MDRVRYEIILAQLGEVLGLCRNLDLQDELSPTSRFLQYEPCLHRLIEISAQRVSGERVTGLGLDEQPLYLTALVESAELGETADYLATCDPDILRPKLRDILRGPPLPIEEDSTSNHARNIMFELSLAAKFDRVGVRAHLSEHPDLWIEVGGKKLLVECKRPFARRAVKDRLSDARRQLDRRFPNEPAGTRGLIALSLSKVINRGDKVLEYSSEPAGRLALEKELENMVVELRGRWKTFEGKKILGVLAHVITPALDHAANRYVVAQQTELHTWARPGSADQWATHELGAAVEAMRR